MFYSSPRLREWPKERQISPTRPIIPARLVDGQIRVGLVGLIQPHQNSTPKCASLLNFSIFVDPSKIYVVWQGNFHRLNITLRCYEKRLSSYCDLIKGKAISVSIRFKFQIDFQLIIKQATMPTTYHILQPQWVTQWRTVQKGNPGWYFFELRFILNNRCFWMIFKTKQLDRTNKERRRLEMKSFTFSKTMLA